MQNMSALHFVKRKNFFFDGFWVVRQELCRIMRDKSRAVRLAAYRNKVYRFSNRIVDRLLDFFGFIDFFANNVFHIFFQVRNGDCLFAGFYLYVLGQVFKLDDTAFRKHNRVFHDVLEFTDVAGVGVFCQCVKSCRFQIVNFLALRFFIF